ncbi:MAG: TIGR04190 family B12-binding domain/radical SAM domain protein [Candidatus Njordarchaeales archaeon]
MHDIVFLHPPAFPNFRNKSIDFGPISDVIPSYPIFDTYPLGLTSLLVYLEKHGFKARIVNIAARMILSKRFNLIKVLKNIKAKVYAIDLHWLVHLNGTLSLASLIKKIHDAPILLGGLSATYFWKKLIKLPFIDFIIRGDTTEEPLRIFLDLLDKGCNDLSKVPNLVWKRDEKIMVNDFNYVPDTFDAIDYTIFVRCAARDGWLDYLPFANFITAPITGIFTVKGCTMNCAACGGSQFSYKKYFRRNKLAIKQPEKIIEEALSLEEKIKAPIFFVGDLQQTRKTKTILRALRREKIDSPLIFEFFRPPNKELLEEYRKAGDQVYLQISPESHDDRIRLTYGRPFTTNQLLKFVKNVVRLDFDRLDIYFMIGLPLQDISSALDTAKFASKLLYPGKIESFIAPLAPFIDPGSLAYEYPERFGYKILFRRLSEYSQALNREVWFQMLNYESDKMGRKEIALATYKATKLLIQEKVRKNIIPEEQARILIKKIKLREKIISENTTLENGKIGLERITCDLKELYPSKNFLLSLKPRLICDAIIGYLCRL